MSARESRGPLVPPFGCDWLFVFSQAAAVSFFFFLSCIFDVIVVVLVLVDLCDFSFYCVVVCFSFGVMPLAFQDSWVLSNLRLVISFRISESGSVLCSGN